MKSIIKLFIIILTISLTACSIPSLENVDSTNDNKVISDDTKEDKVSTEEDSINDNKTIEVDEDFFTKPVLSYLSGKHTIGKELNSGGIYDIHIKGSGRFSITDSSYNIVIDEEYPNVQKPTEYKIRVALDTGYIFDVPNGMVIDIYNARPISDVDTTLTTGYWLVGSDIEEGSFNIKLKNVYASPAYIAVYQDGELIDTIYYVKNDDNDATSKINLQSDEVIVISGISEITFTKE